MKKIISVAISMLVVVGITFSVLAYATSQPNESSSGTSSQDISSGTESSPPENEESSQPSSSSSTASSQDTTSKQSAFSSKTPQKSFAKTQSSFSRTTSDYHYIGIGRGYSNGACVQISLDFSDDSGYIMDIKIFIYGSSSLPTQQLTDIPVSGTEYKRFEILPYNTSSYYRDFEIQIRKADGSPITDPYDLDVRVLMPYS